jgi:hypothetical protein
MQENAMSYGVNIVVDLKDYVKKGGLWQTIGLLLLVVARLAQSVEHDS